MRYTYDFFTFDLVEGEETKILIPISQKLQNLTYALLSKNGSILVLVPTHNTDLITDTLVLFGQRKVNKNIVISYEITPFQPLISFEITYV